MPNSIKYSTTIPPNSLHKGNVALGVNNVDYGPTTTTGWYNGVTPASGKYVIYKTAATGDPDVFAPQSDQELYNFVIMQGGGAGDITSTANALSWIATQSDLFAVNNTLPNIVTDGLLLYVDAGEVGSYPTTGTPWYDLSGESNNGILTNGPTYSTSGGGSIVFDGVDDRIDFGNVLNFGTTDTFSVSVWFNNSKILNSSENIYGLVNKFYGNGINGWTICLRGYSSGIMVRFSTTGTFGDVELIGVTKAQMSDGNWHNITVTYDTNDLCSVYVDGNLKGIQTFTNYDFTNSVPLSIGSFNNSNIYLNQDKISTTSIYNRALSQSEVLQNYNAQKSRFGL